MTNPNKGIALPVIIAVVAVLLAGGAYLAIKNRAPAPATEPAPTQPPAPAVNEVDTSNWQTYRNEEYGFEFRYPVGAAVLGTPDGVVVGDWQVVIFKNQEQLQFEDWFRSNFDAEFNSDCSPLIAGSQFIVRASTFPGNCRDSGFYLLNIDKTKIAQVAFETHQRFPPGSTLYQILSTFKFIR